MKTLFLRMTTFMEAHKNDMEFRAAIVGAKLK